MQIKAKHSTFKFMLLIQFHGHCFAEAHLFLMRTTDFSSRELLTVLKHRSFDINVMLPVCVHFSLFE